MTTLISDSRILKSLNIKATNSATIEQKPYVIQPLVKKLSYVGDFFETPESLIQSHQDLVDNLNTGPDNPNNNLDEHLDMTKKRIEAIKTITTNNNLAKMYSAGFSVIHPYALLRLYGSSIIGSKTEISKNSSDNTIDLEEDSTSNVFDESNKRKWYEVNGKSESINYAKNPTTLDIINFGMQDSRGRFPYAFTDFVYCKYWNKIQNNRMITLRRYPNPVTDNVEPNNFVGGSDEITKQIDASSGNKAETTTASLPSPFPSPAPYSPLVTAVTYFGEGTGNTLSDLLKFTIGYNWGDVSQDVWISSSTQTEASGMINGNDWLSSGIGKMAEILGVLGDFKGNQTINPVNAVGWPPDPYASGGAYENRIIGPINVINSVKRRERGLKFTQDNLSVTFEYVARPIAGINNKAIMLDLFANMMAMTGSSGQFFGGARRYRQEHPAIYPWRNLSEWNKLYSGRLFGKDGMFNSMFRRVFNSDNFSFFGGIVKDLLDGVCQMAKDLVSSVTGSGKDESEEAKEKRSKSSFYLDKITGTAGRALAAKWVKGTNAPWLTSAHALLTGDPVGDWHLTIGNPLNPIAMIGNLIVEDAEYEFSNELGPDDFPISFKCTVHLKHGMGRDKDATESMFNRGAGRIYILSDKFKSSADYETTVDNVTGRNNNDKGTFNYNPSYGILVPSGTDYIDETNVTEIINSTDYNKISRNYNPNDFSSFTNITNQNKVNTVITSYTISNKFMHHIL